MNSFPHESLDKIESAKQVLFYTKPEVLLLDNAISHAVLESNGNEGLVSTIDSTLWYINFAEKATIRIISSHADVINDFDTQKNIINDNSYIKPNNLCTCSRDKTVRIWSLSSFDQLVAFRQKVIPSVVKFSS